MKAVRLMSKAIITPNKLSGTIAVPPSKSYSHRGLIAAALSVGSSKVDNLLFSKDIEATLDCLKSLDVKFHRVGDSVIFEESKLQIVDPIFRCNESGSTIRFMVPIAAAVGGDMEFIGEGRLVSRPLDPYIDIFNTQQIENSFENGLLPLRVNGKLNSGIFNVPGNISSQFITGLLYALPLLEGNSEIHITNKLESINYVDLTIDILEKFGVVVVVNSDYSIFKIKGNQKYLTSNYTVEGDFSQAAFWLVAGLISDGIKLKNIKSDSLQGDKAIIDISLKMGGKLSFIEDILDVQKSATKGIVIDVSDIPDLVPILAVLGSLSEGRTEIINGARVRLKESDRLKAIATELNKIGGDITETEDGLIINGVDGFTGGEVEGWNDHRIVMALSIASIACKDKLIINDAKAVEKSYPHFFKDFVDLGGIIDELCME